MRRRFFLPLLTLSLAMPCAAAAEPVSFHNEVMAVLSRGGCNQGACHGNQNGKNGFKLSLRGEDADFDHAALTRDMLGRRVNVARPDDSLLLLKAAALLPHEGGRRFAPDSPEYHLLRRWIADGATLDVGRHGALRRLDVTPRQQVLVEPADRVTLRVRATFADGSTHDVTRLAVFEVSNPIVTVHADAVVERRDLGETTVLVRYLDKQVPVQLAFVPARPEFAWPDVPEVNYVDRHVFTKLRSLRMAPSALCSDSVFVRRAYLDALGVLPTADEARQFLADTASDKRARLIDRLLERPEFADAWALKWSDLLRNEEKTLDRKGVEVFHQWLRQSVIDHKPLNELAREVIAARGSTYSQPAANFYRALRDPYSRSEAAVQVFLGIRMQCAKCHNHPFDQWTQDDYHRFAAFFARVDYTIVENKRRDNLDKHEFVGDQVVWMARSGEVKHPRTGEALAPRFLGAPAPLAGDIDRLTALADWVARPDNPFFARTQANRIWYHLLGRGVVEPNDDFRASNPAANGPLLRALTDDLVKHRFDLHHLVRTVMNSRTYQLAAAPNATNRDDEANFAHAEVRPLQAEQLLDALAQVTGVPVEFRGYPLGTRAGQVAGAFTPGRRDDALGDGARFLKSFGKPERLLTCECERSEDTTLNQAFQLITGELIDGMLTAKDNRLGKLIGAGRSDTQIVGELYLAALSRPPTAKEQAFVREYLAKAGERRKGLEDVLWGLLNSKEFLLRQ